MTPTLAKTPPIGPEWIHEVKFDGWRAQVQVDKGAATIYSKNGADLTKRFRALQPVLAKVAAKSAIIDCELVACDENGLPSFRHLMDLGGKAPALCLFAFDLLYLNDVRLMPMPLDQRKAILQDLVGVAPDRQLQFSESFDDPLRLLAAGEKMNLEGIVSKRKDSAYRSGPTRDWLKVKTVAWRQANSDRHELFRKV